MPSGTQRYFNISSEGFSCFGGLLEVSVQLERNSPEEAAARPALRNSLLLGIGSEFWCVRKVSITIYRKLLTKKTTNMLRISGFGAL
jgi:hypothetical protein